MVLPYSVLFLIMGLMMLCGMFKVLDLFYNPDTSSELCPGLVLFSSLLLLMLFVLVWSLTN